MRLCECGCGESFEGPARKRFLNEAHRKRKRPSAATAPQLPRKPERSLPATEFFAVTRELLEQHGRHRTIEGQAAMALAARIDALPADRDFRGLLADLIAMRASALEGVAVPDDPLDEIARKRRERQVG